ncbi:septation ring formation regulator EzrA [Longibacter salinarum]|uniref:Septation ring formation regulator EzrA n=1 Tax=Longibacter salinarum TaxID=1850348 RepID=A0A2A8CZ29_9BACT|nr:septum formation initiator family protein [Longibacter salinarum]PEN13894.1 septation ring formation regulator EzrA [Longibacter salinarum]
MSLSFPLSLSSLRRWLLVGAGAFLVLWILFFDSHSLLQRYQWHAELEQLTQENARLMRETEKLREQLAEPLSDQTVEQIAREDYGMIRPGETVYRIERK